MFPSDEEEDAGGLSPAKDDDEVWREQTRKTLMNSIKEEYQYWAANSSKVMGTPCSSMPE